MFTIQAPFETKADSALAARIVWDKGKLVVHHQFETFTSVQEYFRNVTLKLDKINWSPLFKFMPERIQACPLAAD